MGLILYRTPEGKTKLSSSYSARKDFKYCKQQFYLTRVRGFREKMVRAAMHYGYAIEAAVQHHIEHGGAGGPAFFQGAWATMKNKPGFADWVYNALEESWETLLQTGTEHLKLFEIMYPGSPFATRIAKPKFQVPLSKKVFPNSPEWADLTNTAYLDILLEVDGKHPALQQMEKTPNIRQLLVDVKALSKPLHERLISLDPQLVEYAWMTRKPDVGFLNFLKVGRGFKGGSHVTLLEPLGPWRAGVHLRVLDVHAGDVYLGSEEALQAYDKATSGPDGKVLKGKVYEKAWKAFLSSSAAVKANPGQFTKQRLQFITAIVPEQDINDKGKEIGQSMVEMVVAAQQNFYPKDGAGIRFPEERCPFCWMRFVCSGDVAGQKEFLLQPKEEYKEKPVEE